MAQETLEEVAHKMLIDYGIKSMGESIKVLKVQKLMVKIAERMYSEEEVRKLSTEFFYHWYNAKGNNTEEGFDKWFEQFKKQ